MRSKGHIGYAAWGLPQGPAFACTLTMSNKTKKTKTKKNASFVWESYIREAFCVFTAWAKCLFDIRIPNKTCVFFSFCFFVLFIVVTVHAKAGP